MARRRSAARDALRRLVPQPLLRRFYAFAPDRLRYDGMASREYKLPFWFRRHVTRRRPQLHRVVVHLTDHCNLNCAGCTHFSNISPRYFADIGEFERDLDRLALLFEGISEIYLLGGEPLLHTDVDRFIYSTRERFPDARINLMTNGVLGDRMADSTWRALAETGSYLVCDLYPVELPVDAMNAAAERFGAKIDWTEPRGEFFRLPIDVEGTKDPADAFHRCRWVNNCPILRHGRLYPCAYIAYSDILATRFDLEGLEYGREDYADLYATDDPYEIMEKLLKPVPWCRHCDFDNLEMRPWSRSSRSLDEWVTPGPCTTPGE